MVSVVEGTIVLERALVDGTGVVVTHGLRIPSRFLSTMIDPAALLSRREHQPRDCPIQLHPLTLRFSCQDLQYAIVSHDGGGIKSSQATRENPVREL